MNDAVRRNSFRAQNRRNKSINKHDAEKKSRVATGLCKTYLISIKILFHYSHYYYYYYSITDSSLIGMYMVMERHVVRSLLKKKKFPCNSCLSAASALNHSTPPKTQRKPDWKNQLHKRCRRKNMYKTRNGDACASLCVAKIKQSPL